MTVNHRAALAEELKKLLPRAWHSDAVVAGGYAADPARAGDIDLWVLNAPADLESVWSMSDDLQRHFKEHKIDAEFLEGAADYPDVPVQVTAFKPILKFAHAEVEMPPQSPQFGWMDVQIMLTPLETIEQLLETFDLSVHKHAWKLQAPADVISASDATKPGEEIRITRFDTAPRTEQRLKVLLKRYGSGVNIEDYLRLIGERFLELPEAA